MAQTQITSTRTVLHDGDVQYFRMEVVCTAEGDLPDRGIFLHQIMEEQGGTARVAVCCGVHPGVCLAAATSGPPEMDELALAAALMGVRSLLRVPRWT